jgi:hypothetical protein
MKISAASMPRLIFIINISLLITSFVLAFYLRWLIQSVFEMRAQILITSDWLHVELRKNILKILCQKIK